ncbi:ABC transporter permease subunit [Clostridium oceanicum]|uniref:ABC transporter permease n=1 Tax=Clostridium oceanicum TaxID=1543 RepID=A0ABN1JAU3_9CLOT
MGALIKNEIIKTLKRKKTWIVFVLFVLLVGLMGVANNYASKSMEKQNSLEYQLTDSKKQLKQVEKDFKEREKKLKHEDKIEYERFVQQNSIEKKALNERIKVLEDKIKKGEKEIDWKKELNSKIEKSKETINDEKIPEAEKSRIRSQLKELNYLKEHNIKPVSEWSFNSYNFILGTVSMLGILFLAVGVCVFMSDIVSGESTPPTLKFLLVQPTSRGKVLFSKFIAVTLISIVMITAVELVSFLVVGIFKDFGNSSYPVVSGTLYKYGTQLAENGTKPLIQVVGSSTIVPIGQFLIKGLLLQALFITTVCAFAFMISCLCKSSMISMATTIIVLVMFNILQSIPLSKIKNSIHLLFVSYGDPFALMRGDLILKNSNLNMTVMFGIGVMVAWSVVCYLIGYIVFKKKDILI